MNEARKTYVLKLYVAGNTPNSVRALKTLKTTFETAKAKLEAKLAGAKTKIVQCQASLTSQGEELKKTAILASGNGVFKIANDPVTGTKLAVGSVVAQGQLIGTIEN